MIEIFRELSKIATKLAICKQLAGNLCKNASKFKMMEIPAWDAVAERSITQQFLGTERKDLGDLECSKLYEYSKASGNQFYEGVLTTGDWYSLNGF